MDHPNIAKVFDGGTTGRGGGRPPYFVMELVKGLPLTEYCDARRLSIERSARTSSCRSARPSSTRTRRGSSTAT